MTTYTLTGIEIYRDFDDDDTVVGVSTGVQLEIVVNDATTTLGYSLSPLEPGEDIQNGSISLNDYDARLDGRMLGDDFSPMDETFIMVNWVDNLGIARTSTVLNLFFEAVNVPGQGVVDLDFIVQVSGHPLPNVNSVATWNDFEGRITSVSNPTGTFGPGTIALSSLGGAVSQNDLINGTAGNDSFDGGAGNDTISGFNGDDTLMGGAGNDVLNGGNGNDALIGGAGNDTIRTGNNDFEDAVHAGTGNDRVEFSGMSGNAFAWLDHTELGAGVTVDLDADSNTMSVDKGVNGTTTVIDINDPLNAGGFGISGTAHDDTFNFHLDGGWMMVRGEGGDDTINITGSVGGFRVDYRSSTAGIVANLATGSISDDGMGGSDTLIGSGHATEIRSSMHDDMVTGSARNESFILMAGDDTLDGGAGFDRLRYDRTGVTALDVDLDAGTATGIWRGVAFTHDITGIEHVRGSNLVGSIIDGSLGNELLEGGALDDDIAAGGGDDTLNGWFGNDTLRGEDGDDLIDGNEGNDLMNGQNGNDTVDGGNGNDSVFGGADNDLLFGRDGNDFVGGGAGNDTVFAGTGNDLVYGATGNDVLGGGADDDRVFAGGGNDLVYGGAGNDNMGGAAGDDRLFAGSGNDVMYGSNGNDTMGGAAGDDSFFGGNGNDVQYGNNGDDTLRGGDDDDKLFAGAGDDLLRGQDGNDTLRGANGNDTLDGGAGNDRLVGGDGSDTFVFSGGADVIVDFDRFGADADVIDLSGVASITGFADLISNHVTQVGGNVIIDDLSGNTLTINGATIASLDAGMFDF